LLPDGLIDGLRENADQRRERLRSQRADQFSFVAEDAGEVAGYALGGSERTGDAEYRGEVYAIYVLPAHQGKGLGRALIRESARELARRGLDSLVIWVLRENEVGRFRVQAFEGRPVVPLEREKDRREDLGLERDEIVRVLRPDHGELPLQTAHAPREIRREVPVTAARGVRAFPPGDAHRSHDL